MTAPDRTAAAVAHGYGDCDAVIDRLVTELAKATGRPEAVVRLSAGLGSHGHPDGTFSRERAVSGDDSGQNKGGRP